MTAVPALYSPLDIDTLIRTVYGEARGEPMEGKIAVAHVALNRLKHPGWWSRNRDDIPDDTLAAVCRDPYQFSCWLENDPNRNVILTALAPALAESAQAVELVLAGIEPDPTGGATHYHAIGAMPKWAAGRTPTAIIGHHVFYEDIA